MERTKRISTQSLAIAVLSVLLVASLVMSATGAWFSDVATDSDDGFTFGTITIGDLDAQFNYTLGEPEGDVIMPGDEITVTFDIENTGTADMWVRFQLNAIGDGADHFTTPASEQAPTGYTYVSGDQWFYRDAPMHGYLELANDPKDEITFTFNISDDIGNTAEGDEVEFVLSVEVIQFANNDDRMFDGWEPVSAE